jgi:hypothetical protein
VAIYALETRLPSYFIHRAFLKDAERFVLEQAKNLQKEAYEPNDYKVKIQDKTGTQTLNSIDEFQYSEFPNDTQFVELEYRGWRPVRFNVELRFDKEVMFTNLNITIESESPRQQA